MGHKAKYRLTCVAPNELTTYNKEWNKKVEDECEQSVKFEPNLVTCLRVGPNDCKCKYLKITRLS